MTAIPIPNPEHSAGPVTQATALVVPDEPLTEQQALQQYVARALDVFERPRWNLRELATEAILLDALLDFTGGEVSPEVERYMDQLSTLLAGKADGVASYLLALESDVETAEQEHKRLGELLATRKRRHAQFKAYVLQQLQRMGLSKIEGDYKTVAVQRNGQPALVIDQRGLLPKAYEKTEVVVSVDNAALKDAIKATGTMALRVEVVRALAPSERISRNEEHNTVRIDRQSIASDGWETALEIPCEDVIVIKHDDVFDVDVLVYLATVAHLEHGYHLRVR